MNTPTFTVNGHWRRRTLSSPETDDLEAQTITGTRAPFVLPPEPARTRAPVIAAIDDFFGAATTREGRRGPREGGGGGGGGGGDLALPPPPPPLPPPYADADLPAYSADPSAADEPITLAKYLFKSGFLFPPLWVLGALILFSPLSAPADFEPSKSGTERRQLVRTIRDAELRWATRCAWALVALLVGVGAIVVVLFVVLRA